MGKIYYVYILANQKNGTLYIGITNNLERRVYEHKKGITPGFTKKYGLKILVHFDETDNMSVALTREKQLKKWNRKWKIRLIEETNPTWEDLAEGWFDENICKKLYSLDSRLHGKDNDKITF